MSDQKRLLQKVSGEAVRLQMLAEASGGGAGFWVTSKGTIQNVLLGQVTSLGDAIRRSTCSWTCFCGPMPSSTVEHALLCSSPGSSSSRSFRIDLGVDVLAGASGGC